MDLGVNQRLTFLIKLWKVQLIAILLVTMTVFDGLDAYTNPKYIWPLTEDTYTYEASDGSHGDYSQCGFHFENTPSHPNFASDNALCLDTVQYPYVDIEISNDNEFKFFSFAFSVKTSSAVGCILHFDSQSSSSSTIYDFRLCFDASSDLKWTYTYGSSRINDLSIAYGTLNSWTLVILARNFDTERMYLKVGNSETDLHDTGFSDEVLGLRGTLRVGALHDGTSSFTGCITCLTMFDTHDVSYSNRNDIYSECSGTSASGLPSPGPGCVPITTTTTTTPAPTTTTTTVETTTTTIQETTTSLNLQEKANDPMQSNYYRVVAVDMEPQLPAETIITLTVLRTGRCASECAKYTNCWSFSVESLSIEHKQCTLFSAYSNLNLASVTGVKTYKVLSKST